MLPINLRAPLIVVKKRYYQEFIAGTKTVEYRRHRRPFLRRTYYPDRIVRLTYSYDFKKHPSRLARVLAFDIVRAEQVTPEEAARLLAIYRDLRAADEIALITLALLDE